LGLLVGSFDELAGLKVGAGADEGDEMRGVHRAPSNAATGDRTRHDDREGIQIWTGHGLGRILPTPIRAVQDAVTTAVYGLVRAGIAVAGTEGWRLPNR
jgi:hypothetical protein